MRGVSQYGISSGLGNAWLRYTERNERSLKELYLRAWDMRAAAWLVATAALGLSAGIISKKPGGPLVVAAAYNLCAVCICTFLSDFFIEGKTTGYVGLRKREHIRRLTDKGTTLYRPVSKSSRSLARR